MLVLTRKKAESLLIGDITVHILKIEGARVKVGIDAPAGYSVRRGELASETARGLMEANRIASAELRALKHAE